MKYQIGEVIFKDEDITINKGSEPIEIIVNNHGDRSIQICSHFHFFESNPALKFDREKAFGMRLDIPSGAAVRFEPGEDKAVNLIPYRGTGDIYGFRGMTMGNVSDPKVRERAFKKAKELETGGNE